MAAVTFRGVAAESGMSLGAVQKAFPAKDELIRGMLRRMRETAVAGVRGEPGRPALRGWLTELTITVLPLDDTRRTAQLHASALAERAAFDPVVGDAIASGDQELIGNVARLIRRGVAEGEVSEEVDAYAAARAWLALTQGFATQLLYAPRDEAEVSADVTFVIQRLLGPDPR